VVETWPMSRSSPISGVCETIWNTSF
jgi:hypothetical protein